MWHIPYFEGQVGTWVGQSQKKGPSAHLLHTTMALSTAYGPNHGLACSLQTTWLLPKWFAKQNQRNQGRSPDFVFFRPQLGHACNLPWAMGCHMWHNIIVGHVLKTMHANRFDTWSFWKKSNGMQFCPNPMEFGALDDKSKSLMLTNFTSILKSCTPRSSPKPSAFGHLGLLGI